MSSLQYTGMINALKTIYDWVVFQNINLVKSLALLSSAFPRLLTQNQYDKWKRGAFFQQSKQTDMIVIQRWARGKNRTLEKNEKKKKDE